MRRIAFTLMACASAVASAQTYKWVDEKGVVHYSDRPHPGAEKVELQSAQTYEAKAAAAKGAQQRTAAAAPGAAPDPDGYARCEVVTPANDETLVNAQSMTAAVRVEPQLRPGHLIALVLDGRAVQDPGRATSFQIEPIFRGTHSMMMVVQDSTGLTLCRSPVITFHVRQPSVVPTRGANAPTVPKAPQAPPAR